MVRLDKSRIRKHIIKLKFNCKYKILIQVYIINRENKLFKFFNFAYKKTITLIY